MSLMISVAITAGLFAINDPPAINQPPKLVDEFVLTFGVIQPVSAVP
jgi:hypothetical protein